MNDTLPLPTSITCVIFANKVGGTERVLAALAKAWAQNGHNVRIVETDGAACEPFYRIPDNIRRVRLDLGGASHGRGAAIINNIRRIVSLRRVLRNDDTDVVISFLTEQNIVTILAALGTSLPVIVSERTDPYTARKPFVWRALRWLTYRCADRVVVLNQRASRYFSSSARTTVIPNPVVVSDNKHRKERDPTVIGLGRLVNSKRFDVLISAFAAIAPSHPGWQLTIMGDGPERRRLEDKAENFHVMDRVSFLGSVAYPEIELGRAAIFVSCSELEGFPMALCEAMAGGLPVVAAKYNESIEEIVENEWNGLLVPPDDIDATSRAILRLIEDEALRKRLGRNARASMERFRPQRVLNLWSRLFEEVGVHPYLPSQRRRRGMEG